MGLRNKLEGAGQLWRFDNRWELLWRHLTGAADRVDVYRYGPIRLAVDRAAGDAAGAREVFATPMYRQWLEAMDLTSPLTLLDLGAHIGSFTLLVRALRYDIDRVVCAEMNPNTFARLTTNIGNNLSTGYVLRHAAVCDRVGHLDIALGTGDTGDSLYAGPGRPGASTTHRIATTTFDDVVESGFGTTPIDVCKIDIEGAEYDVIGSASCTALARCRYLIIEIHDRPGHSADDLRAAIARAGFSRLHLPSSGPGAVEAYRHTELTRPVTPPP